jgi:protein-L-isoaspartate(D-aspartate) O-methyltransferase
VNENYFATLRQQMIGDIAVHVHHARGQIGKEALDAEVMRVMAGVPRHEFVPVELQLYAYCDTPLPIGYDKTISQPFIVALMTDLLDLRETDTVLEIGTGLGYQAAILAELAGRVLSIEIIEELAQEARVRLDRLDYGNIDTRVGDGYFGWPEAAPFDKIIVTAAPELIPPPLIRQLKCGGRLVLPAGLPESQKLILAQKDKAGSLSTKEILDVRFSPLEGSEEHQVMPSFS